MSVSILVAIAGWAAFGQAVPIPIPTAPPPAAPPPPTPVPSGKPVEVRRHPLFADRPDAWPERARLIVTATPDWADDRTYPVVARRLELEGRTMFELRVDAGGVPRDCRILASSGHVILDDATCDRALEIRFAPHRDADGRAVASAYLANVNWLLNDPTPFGPGRLTVHLELAGEQAIACRVERSGAAPREWARFACRSLAAELPHYLGDAFGRAERAAIVVSIEPAGASPTAAGAGRRVAHRRIAFDVDSEGNARNCRKTLDLGFGPAARDYSDTCGLFLSRAWLEPGRGEGAPRSGTLDLSVYVESPR